MKYLLRYRLFYFLPMQSVVQTKTFTFKDDFNFNSTKECRTTITIEDTISNNSPVYHIAYNHNIVGDGVNYAFNGFGQDVPKPCPFAYFPDVIKESFEGVIIIKNEMTTPMVKYLMMEDDELSKHCGLSSPADYRKKIMVLITQFWD